MIGVVKRHLGSLNTPGKKGIVLHGEKIVFRKFIAVKDRGNRRTANYRPPRPFPPDRKDLIPKRCTL